jgi:hypothetical protein
MEQLGFEQLTNNSYILNFAIVSLATYFVVELIKVWFYYFSHNKFFIEVVLPTIPMLTGIAFGLFVKVGSLNRFGCILFSIVAAQFSGLAYRIVRALIRKATGIESQPPKQIAMEEKPTIPSPPRIPHF